MARRGLRGTDGAGRPRTGCGERGPRAKQASPARPVLRSDGLRGDAGRSVTRSPFRDNDGRAAVPTRRHDVAVSDTGVSEVPRGAPSTHTASPGSWRSSLEITTHPSRTDLQPGAPKPGERGAIARPGAGRGLTRQAVRAVVDALGAGRGAVVHCYGARSNREDPRGRAAGTGPLGRGRHRVSLRRLHRARHACWPESPCQAQVVRDWPGVS